MDTGQLPDVTSTQVTRADGAGGAEDGSRPQVRHGDQARLVFASFLMLAGRAPVGEVLDLAFTMKIDPNPAVVENALERLATIARQ